ATTQIMICFRLVIKTFAQYFKPDYPDGKGFDFASPAY
ncbi:MAG: hypothetical protein QOF56_1613, partial [Acidobacteriaceae bacterium]|nr:hypothetical protein [Acidobacteriaceae bacterium]